MGNVIDFLQNVVLAIVDAWWKEWSKVRIAYFDRLKEIWAPQWGDLWWLAFPFFSAGALVPRMLDTLEATQEFAQDTGLVWQRITVDVADDLIPVPDSWKNRVVRADQMLRFFVQECLRFGVNIQDLDPPPELDMTKLVEKYVAVDKIVDQVKVGAVAEAKAGAMAAAKASLIFQLTVAVGNILKVIAAIILAVFAGYIVWRAHTKEFSERVLAERALPQDSPRVRTARPGGQHRVNQRTGPDR